MIGAGYVGLVSGACLAHVGNNVVCLDLDEEGIAIMNGGGVRGGSVPCELPAERVDGGP